MRRYHRHLTRQTSRVALLGAQGRHFRWGRAAGGAVGLVVPPLLFVVSLVVAAAPGFGGPAAVVSLPVLLQVGKALALGRGHLLGTPAPLESCGRGPSTRVQGAPPGAPFWLPRPVASQRETACEAADGACCCCSSVSAARSRWAAILSRFYWVSDSSCPNRAARLPTSSRRAVAVRPELIGMPWRLRWYLSR